MSNDEKDKKPSNKVELAVFNMMKNEDCREFIWSHLQSCGVFESIFDDNPVKHGYNSGSRDAGLMLARSLKEYAPGYYLKMIEENING